MALPGRISLPKSLRKMTDMTAFDLSPYLVPPGKKVSLAKDFDPRFHDDLASKDSAAGLLAEDIEALVELQAKLYADDAKAVLVIFQAMDAAGKDGAIKHVMSGLNPQGCDVHSFKAPSHHELDHTFLWRHASTAPERGRIGIHNRSHYEEVLVTRVHPEILENQRLPDEPIGDALFRQRYEEINDFERHLVRNGTTVIKFFLNVSKDEQKKRFLERIDQPDKNWKFAMGDVDERQHWDEYQAAYEEVLRHTSTAWAPWHVVPADRKWFTRLVVARVLRQALEDLDLSYPTLDEAALADLATARTRLESE